MQTREQKNLLFAWGPIEVPRLTVAELKEHALLCIPVVLWLSLFQVAGSLPDDIRPSIDVSTLPFVERLFFGYSLLYKLFPPVDILVVAAAVPYLAHFSIPFLFSVYLWKVDGKPTLYLWYFGVMNLTAVLTQLLYPTAPPWYNAKYGVSPASYDLPGDPGRLGRADLMLDFPLFHSLYGASPVVFGSFPSLHAAWPFLLATYTTLMSVPFPTVLKWCYVLWVWWAAIFTKHHFLVDVLGGALYVALAVVISKYVLKKDIISYYLDKKTEEAARKAEPLLPVAAPNPSPRDEVETLPAAFDGTATKSQRRQVVPV
mmetsp:Transcript_22074/g.86817  ORF Transcript_22074/g.86817 Transcript_22074/m.86817 type:complete len:315 (-) Transcript_22074:56-1000(-)